MYCKSCNSGLRACNCRPISRNENLAARQKKETCYHPIKTPIQNTVGKTVKKNSHFTKDYPQICTRLNNFPRLMVTVCLYIGNELARMAAIRIRREVLMAMTMSIVTRTTQVIEIFSCVWYRDRGNGG